MNIICFLVIVISFLLSLGLTSLLRKLSSKHGVLMHNGIPVSGGIAIALAFSAAVAFSFLCYGEISLEAAGIILSALLLFVFGLIDDWLELSVMMKFLFQILGVSLLVLFGIKTRIVYIGDFLNLIITFVWVLGITNAFNHLDVMDGVAAVTAGLAGAGFFAISLLQGDSQAMILALALIGAAAGFLLFNLPPAKIYMGNSGSHFLGFVLAAIAMVISYAPLERKVALAAPLLILGLAIFDTSFLILIRLSKGKLPFNKSNDHLVLRFLAIRASKRLTLFIVFCWGLLFALTGIAVSMLDNLWAGIIVSSAIIITLIVLFKMSKVKIDG